MNRRRERYLTVLMAVFCMSAVGITSTTLMSTLETDPDDVIDFSYKYLPFGEESVREVKLESRANAGGGGGSDSNEQQSGGSLMAILWTLLALLLALLALGLAYRYRDRFLAAVQAGRTWLGERTPTPGGSGGTTWPSREPTNDVHRAWLSMVERANVDRPRVRSPHECARAAVNAGLDSEAVATITGLFEEDRYGGAPLTGERRRRAREWLRRIDKPGGP